MKKEIPTKEDIYFQLELIQVRIMKQIELYMQQNNISKYEFGSKLGLPEEYLTKLFQGNEKLTLELLAKIQLLFNIEFEFRIKQ